jgi:hypothetical protein
MSEEQTLTTLIEAAGILVPDALRKKTDAIPIAASEFPVLREMLPLHARAVSRAVEATEPYSDTMEEGDICNLRLKVFWQELEDAFREKYPYFELAKAANHKNAFSEPLAYATRFEKPLPEQELKPAQFTALKKKLAHHFSYPADQLDVRLVDSDQVVGAAHKRADGKGVISLSRNALNVLDSSMLDFVGFHELNHVHNLLETRKISRRQGEFDSDEHGARHSDGDSGAEALFSLAEHNADAQNIYALVRTALALRFLESIQNPELRHIGFSAFINLKIDTQNIDDKPPLTTERIKRLQDFADQQWEQKAKQALIRSDARER